MWQLFIRMVILNYYFPQKTPAVRLILSQYRSGQMSVFWYRESPFIFFTSLQLGLKKVKERIAVGEFHLTAAVISTTVCQFQRPTMRLCALQHSQQAPHNSFYRSPGLEQ